MEYVRPWYLEKQEGNNVTIRLQAWAALKDDDALANLTLFHLFDDVGLFSLELAFSA